MVKINYELGPKTLQDVSHETFTCVSKMLKNNVDPSIIIEETHINAAQLVDIDKIVKSGMMRCCFCGDIFKPSTPRRIKCYKEKHFLPCIDCGRPVEIKEAYAEYQKAGGRRCSECRGKQIGATRRGKSKEEKDAIVAKQQSTMIERYGAATPLQVPEMKAKIQATIKEKYGVNNLSQSKEIQDKIKKNSREKYGVDHYSNDPEIRKHMIEGMVKKYGVENAQQSTEIHERTKQTNLERYGVENVFQNEEVRKTFVRNHKAKYGVDWPHQRPDLIEQVKQTNREKYGADMYPVSDDYMRKFISNPEKFDNYKAFMSDPESYIKSNYINKPSVKQLSEDLGVTDSPIYDKLISIDKRNLATEYAFSMENQLIEFLVNLDKEMNIVKHDRKILDGLEIDVYLPDYRIGFECNPTYTHNSTFLDPWKGKPKHPNYHADKSIIGAKNGVFIYHIFGYEWTNNRSKVMSQIRNILGFNKKKIYARSTYLDEISHSEAKFFLDINHRQGFAHSKIRLGLRDKNSGELLSLMTFGKMRAGIGKDSRASEKDWELIRFCNVKETSVVGGASKLFTYFVNNYDFNKIVSFSDIAHTRGTIYERLGFHLSKISPPGYVWVNLKTDKYFNRISCQKSNIPNLFEDVTDETIRCSTEEQIMMDHGYAKVYDSGVLRWEYCANE